MFVITSDQFSPDSYRGCSLLLVKVKAIVINYLKISKQIRATIFIFAP